MHAFQRLGILTAAVFAAIPSLLGGCAGFGDYFKNGLKVGPNYAQPPAAVPSQWIEADDARVRSDAQNLSQWWSVFNDPTLDSLIDEAAAQNLSLREAGFRILQARASLGFSQGNIWPQTQEAFGGYSRQRVSTNSATGSSITDRSFDDWTVGFGVAWELDLWGKFRRAIESSEASLDASIDSYGAVLVTLLGDVATNYVQYRVLERQIVLVNENVELQRTTLTLADARFRGGQTSELDVEQARSNLAQTEAQVPQLETALRQTNNSLCVLLGVPPEQLAARLGSAPIPTAPPELALGIPAELLTRRPDVRQAEREAAAQSAQIGIAQAEFYPAISITGSLGFQAQKVSNLFDSDSFFGAIGPSFQWNILNYGRIESNVAFQDARFKELVARYQNVVLQAAAEVENGLIVFLKSQETVVALGASVIASQKAVDIAIAQYKGQIVDFNRVALLQQNLVTQQDQLAQAQGQIALGLIQVYRALGGGWGDVEPETPGETKPAPAATADEGGSKPVDAA